jgi:hypothetical protein
MEFINNILKQLNEQGFKSIFIEYINVGIEYNVEYNLYDNVIEICTLNLNYCKKLKSNLFIENEKYKFKFTYKGEKSFKRPGENILCKMTPEKRKELLSKYN